eukprot:4635900-Amphidinium_carterae.1
MDCAEQKTLPQNREGKPRVRIDKVTDGKRAQKISPNDANSKVFINHFLWEEQCSATSPPLIILE